MRYQSYFNKALLLISQYDGSQPLLHFLKNYFSQNKKHGSKDRKWIAHICYNYFRLGHALKGAEIAERIRVAIFLCNAAPGDWAILFTAHWIENWKEVLTDRINFIQETYPDFSLDNIFPWTNALSKGIDKNAFLLSFFIQPDLHFRIRPGYENRVGQKLLTAQIPFTKLGTHALALPNGSKVDAILEIDKEAVIQDYNSQRVAEFFPKLQTPNSKLQTRLWDCCAASGGKSILAYDHLSNIDLTVSDIRPSILKNLKERFEHAGIKKYQSFTADLSTSKFEIRHSTFDILLCDAPCSGSGTWGRTPEQLYFFKEEEMHVYAALQKKIVQNILPAIKPGGFLLYITCSVFKVENEAMVDTLLNDQSLQLVKQEVLKGYAMKADSMFVALLQKV